MAKNEISKEELISNRILGLLAVITIFVLSIGILTVRQPEIVYYPLSGYATLVNATVQAEVLRTNSIAVVGAIRFGTGIVYANNTAQPVVLNSTGNCAVRNTSFVTGACTAADNSTNKFTVENDGNINVTVTVDINVSLASLGLGLGGDFAFLLGQEERASASQVACTNESGLKGSTDSEEQFPNATGYRSLATRNITGAAISLEGLPISIYSVVGHSNAAGTAAVVICSKLQPDDTFDTMNMTVYLNISQSATPGTKNYRLNFTSLDRFTSEP